MISIIYTIFAAVLLTSCCRVNGLPTAELKEHIITADLLIKLYNKNASVPIIEHEMPSIVDKIFLK